MASLESLRSAGESASQERREASLSCRDTMQEVAAELLPTTDTPASITGIVVSIDGVSTASAVESGGPPAINAFESDTTGAVVVVVGAAQRREDLEAKKLFRPPAAKITALMPFGGAGLQLKVPKRKDYGEEGEEGDAAHAAAMKQFSVKEFGNSHVEQRVIDARMGRVGQFGFWLHLNHYGKYVEWQVAEGPHGKARCMVAVERDDTPRVVADVAVMECMRGTDRMAGSAGLAFVRGC